MKFSKYSKQNSSQPVRIKEKVVKKYGISKNVKSDNLSVDFHVVLEEKTLAARLILIASILFVAISILSLIFSVIRTENIKNNISGTKERLAEIEVIKENIDYYNELYVYDMMFGNDNVYSQHNIYLFVILKNLWDYEITVQQGDGDEVTVTNENINTITVFEKGKNYSVRLYETMDEAYIPEQVALKGNIYQGDETDSLHTHFYILKADNLIKTDGGAGLTTNIVDGKEFIKIENVLTYTFTATDDTQIGYSPIFESLLEDYILND